ncbi:hypothetical protein [Paracidovorax anthurii]|uniref:hypothetical protein n=1 Tax=Paracidovorax anthurii TaxID=78229 RepID=UPI001473D1F9|nr:hypothetical protein [Paracidovorax anthurii]
MRNLRAGARIEQQLDRLAEKAVRADVAAAATTGKRSDGRRARMRAAEPFATKSIASY